MNHIIVLSVETDDRADTVTRSLSNNLMMAIEAGNVFDCVELSIDKVEIITRDGLTDVDV